MGKIRSPHYRIVVADSRTKRDGRAIEEIGRYVPGEHPSIIEVNHERAQYWLSVGAQPSEQVLVLLKLTGDYQASKGEKAENKVQVKPAKVEFVADAAKKTVLRPKAEIVVKAAEPVVEAVAEDAAVEEAAAEVVSEEVSVEAVEAVAEEAAAEVVAEEVAAEVAAEEAPAAEAEVATDEAPAAPAEEA
jgi:small subunit ribosomal protein S16